MTIYKLKSLYLILFENMRFTTFIQSKGNFDISKPSNAENFQFERSECPVYKCFPELAISSDFQQISTYYLFLR